MNGISSKALAFGSPENKKKYQGYEYNTDFDLNLYESFYRTHDPQLGRFWQIDPKPSFNESLYAAMGNNPIKNFDFLGDIYKSGNSADNTEILAWIAKGLNLKKGQVNPFSFNKKGVLGVNKSNLKKLSKYQQGVAGNIVQGINAKEIGVISIKDKDFEVSKNPVEPGKEYFKLKTNAEGKSVLVEDDNPGVTTLEDMGGGATKAYDPKTNTTNIYIQRQELTDKVNGQDGSEIAQQHFIVAFHEAFGHFIYRDVQKIGNQQKCETIDYENQVRKLNNMPLRAYDDGHPKVPKD